MGISELPQGLGGQFAVRAAECSNRRQDELYLVKIDPVGPKNSFGVLRGRARVARRRYRGLFERVASADAYPTFAA